MVWLCVLSCVLLIVIFILTIRLILIHRSLDEIRVQMNEWLDSDTNTLLTISSGDRHIRKLAVELNKQLRVLRGERRRYQNGDLELKEAVTNISHDLRTPLTAICGYLDLLKNEEKSEASNRYLAIIENRAEVLKQLTEELFRSSIITSASEDLTLETISLNRALEDSVSAFYALLKSKNIAPEISIPELKVERNLDSKALSRILENVIGNAVKYSDGDLSITLTENGEMIFTNSASKLDEITVGKLFDRFYTVEDAKKSTGLGLSIAKILTEQMNGTVTAEYHNGRLSIHIKF